MSTIHDLSIVFIALLTKHFMKSQWTNQEAGVVLSRNVVLVSIRAGIRPPGFLAGRQYVSMDKQGDGMRKIYRTCSHIARSLAVGHTKLRNEIRSALVASVEHADSYYAAEAILLALEGVPDLTAGNINAVVRGARNNSQVVGAYIAGGPLRRLVAKYMSVIDNAELRKIQEVFDT